MKVGVLFKRRYMSHDVILDRYARLFELPQHMAENGHELLAVCLSYRASSTGELLCETGKKGEIKWLSYNAGPLLLAGTPGYLSAVLREFRKFSPDVLLGGSDAVHVVLTHWLSRKLGVPYVVDLYDNYESFGLTRVPGILPLYRRALKSANGISSVSLPLSQYVSTLAPEARITTIESTIDPTVFYPRDKLQARELLGLAKDARYIGVAGSLSGSRGIGLLYDAFVNLAEKYPDLHLLLAGDIDSTCPPPEHSRVHFIGRISHDEMPVFFSAIDLAVVCMLDTPFGRYAFPQKTYEIIACGTPIVTADLGALSHTFKAYPSSLYVPENLDSLTDKIEAQLVSPCVPEVSVPDWKTQAGKLERLLQEVL